MTHIFIVLDCKLCDEKVLSGKIHLHYKHEHGLEQVTCPICNDNKLKNISYLRNHIATDHTRTSEQTYSPPPEIEFEDETQNNVPTNDNTLAQEEILINQQNQFIQKANLTSFSSNSFSYIIHLEFKFIFMFLITYSTCMQF